MYCRVKGSFAEKMGGEGQDSGQAIRVTRICFSVMTDSYRFPIVLEISQSWALILELIALLNTITAPIFISISFERLLFRFLVLGIFLYICY